MKTVSEHLRRSFHGMFMAASLAIAFGSLPAMALADDPQVPSTPSGTSVGLPMQSVNIDAIPFEIPIGCEWTRADGEGLIRWPIVATWDPEGHLLVAESVWNRESVQQQLISRPHRIVRLIDRDHDGNFDQRVVVADSLSFPEGILAIGKDLFVAAPPEIWKLTDADGDGVCESREVWFDGKTLTHCANDLHGPWLGPDGWIYWSKSAFAEQSHETRASKEWKSSASHLYRRHPNGGPIEPIMTGGMDNLIDVAWLPNGERFFCATFLHHPKNGFRDGIGQATYGAVFGKPHAVLNGHPTTGDLMLPTVDFGPGAPAGLFALQEIDRRFHVHGPAIDGGSSMDGRGSIAGYLLSAQFNLQKVGLHTLVSSPDSAGYKAHSVDLVTSPQIDFHPVDVLLDRDGSLLVLDTGGWYDLCCPSSGTDQRVALGGIYRLRGVTQQIADTRDPRVHGTLPSSVSSEDRSGASETQPIPSYSIKLRKIWDHAQQYVDSESPVARSAIVAFAGDPQPDVRIAALQLISLHRWPEARSVLLENLQGEDARCSRMAAEALGRIGIHSELNSIMDRLQNSASDRWLEHGLLYALIEGASPNELAPYAESPNATTARGAILVLDQTNQLGTDHLPSVLRLATSNDPRAAKLGASVLEKHAEWAPLATDWLQSQLILADGNDPTVIANLLARWSDQASVQQLVQKELTKMDRDDPRSQQLVEKILRAMGTRKIPSAWESPLARWIDASSPQETIWMANLLAPLTWQDTESFLTAAIQTKIASLAAGASMDRLTWIHALPIGSSLDSTQEEWLVEKTVSEDFDSRSLAGKGLRKIRLRSPLGLARMVAQLPKYSPLELPLAIESVLKASQPELDAKLLEQLLRLDSAKTLSIESCISLLRDRPEAIQKKWKESLVDLQRPPEDVAREIEKWLSDLPAGDPSHGFHVFRSTRGACSACHTVGYVGGSIGPVLSHIGKSRTKRDLLEAILFPSARLEQGYRSTKIRTSDGGILIGLVVDESPESLELQVAADRKVAIPKGEIDAREASVTSIMPAGLEKQLSKQELADLLAFLENAK
jgi:putative membrane-bound dehydrogenase-like protein